MQVTKDFHFYAAHRNEEIGGKCANLHGHRYGLKVTVQQPMAGSVTILFEDLENKIRPLIDQLDHSLLLHWKDPAADKLQASGACGKIFWMDKPTSAENLTFRLLEELEKTGLNVVEISLRETDSSVVTLKKEVNK